MKDLLLLGDKGWIGGQFKQYLESQNVVVFMTNARAENYDEMKRIIISTGVKHVVCMIGRTTGPAPTDRETDSSTIDFLEFPENDYLNLRDNFIAPATLATICGELGIHLTYLGTGCIYCYPDVNDPQVYSVNDEPNFDGSKYSRMKLLTDKYMRGREGVLNVRIRMPISNKNEPKNFISKMIKYTNISSCANSMSVFHDLFPALYDMMLNNKTGTVHLVNPGSITHEQILEMYKKYCNSDHTYNLVTDEQLRLRAPRSRCLLAHNLDEFTEVTVPHICESLERIFENGFC